MRDCANEQSCDACFSEGGKNASRKYKENMAAHPELFDCSNMSEGHL
jgi:hypothetical protein